MSREFQNAVLECPDCGADGSLTIVDRYDHANAVVNVLQCGCGFEAEETFKHDKTVEVTHRGE
jgi:predicted RNA-binding Zn-ribbon protein involved in translation (DUF1610 family)